MCMCLCMCLFHIWGPTIELGVVMQRTKHKHTKLNCNTEITSPRSCTAYFRKHTWFCKNSSSWLKGSAIRCPVVGWNPPKACSVACPAGRIGRSSAIILSSAHGVAVLRSCACVSDCDPAALAERHSSQLHHRCQYSLQNAHASLSAMSPYSTQYAYCPTSVQFPLQLSWASSNIASLVPVTHSPTAINPRPLCQCSDSNLPTAMQTSWRQE